MPVCVAQTVQKRTVRGATARHDGDLVSFACHRAPLAAQPPATRAWKGPQSDTLVDALERGHRVAACRGKCLAAVVILPRPEACRSPGLETPWLVFPASSSCRGLAALPERSGASRQVPWCALIGLVSLAYILCSWMAPREPWRVLAFARQALPRGAATARAQVRVLGYPYSSTPTKPN